MIKQEWDSDYYFGSQQDIKARHPNSDGAEEGNFAPLDTKGLTMLRNKHKKQVAENKKNGMREEDIEDGHVSELGEGEDPDEDWTDRLATQQWDAYHDHSGEFFAGYLGLTDVLNSFVLANFL